MKIFERIKKYIAVKKRALGFKSSKNYWIERYMEGKNSGAGSYGKYASFKAEVINDFIQEHDIDKVIEFGCGDGNQLKQLNYSSYLGFDVSPEAIAHCRDLFEDDPSRSFKLMREYDDETAELTVSLDVIFHLVENHVFDSYMNRLFDASIQYVIIYSSNDDRQKQLQFPHVRHRKFTDWIENNRQEWSLMRHIPNKLYDENDSETPPVDFYIYRKDY